MIVVELNSFSSFSGRGHLRLIRRLSLNTSELPCVIRVKAILMNLTYNIFRNLAGSRWSAGELFASLIIVKKVTALMLNWAGDESVESDNRALVNMTQAVTSFKEGVKQ